MALPRNDIPSFGFAGVISSGKSEYLSRLKALFEKELGVKPYVISFSTIIAEVAERKYGVKERTRRALQDVGNEERKEDPEMWARRVIERIHAAKTAPFLVDGIRMPEEAQALKRAFRDFYIIKLIPGDPNARIEAHKKKYGRYPTEEELTDNSDRHVDRIDADITILNSYKKRDMEKQLKGLIAAIKKGTLPEL